MKKLASLSFLLSLLFVAAEVKAQCLTFADDENACPTSNLSARLEAFSPVGIDPDPTRIITNANQIQPDTDYRVYVFHDNFPTANVILCMGNPTGFLPSGFTPFCPTCRDMGSFAYFSIKTTSSYQPGDPLKFDAYVGCSQNKNCGSLYCGSPYEIELVDFGVTPEASFVLP